MGKSSAVDELARALSVAVAQFGATVTPRFATGIVGEPEDKLRGPIETLMESYGTALGLRVTPGGEAHLANLGIRSDFGIHVDGVLTGHLEAKSPGKGVDVDLFRGHDLEQWEKSKSLPNLLYSDGNSWALYRQGERIGQIITLVGDIRSSGNQLRPVDEGLARLLADFLDWEPTAPSSAAELARTAAGLCRLLRDEVLDVLRAEAKLAAETDRLFSNLAAEWRDLLFPGADDEQFADSYAQTVTFALLMARSEAIDLSDLDLASKRLGRQHALLGRALQVLADDQVRSRVSRSLEILQRVLSVVDWAVLTSGQLVLPGLAATSGHVASPWLYFYEDFLAVYDSRLRQEAGAYYTPREVVGAQTRLADDLLRTRLGRKLGFASEDVVVLDPAMGTGSYMVAAIDRAAEAAKAREGDGAVPARLGELVSRLIGFEIMTGPYAVAELQVSEALRLWGVDARKDLRLHLADTLSDPYLEDVHLGGMYEPIARSRRAADKVKTEEEVLVCIGNPPYGRHRSGSGIGGWVRFGHPEAGQSAILEDFVADDIKPGHLANIYNLYVYFWRWALWKVFEAHPAAASGVVAFITASSFLAGPGFAAMRAHIRRVTDEVWVIDLGGEGHGSRHQQNVFPIQTPVAITLCLKRPKQRPAKTSVVRYARLTGTREEKLDRLARIAKLSDLSWQETSTGWRDPFTPIQSADWTAFPLLFDLFPWRAPGVKAKRTWPIAPLPAVLRRRWQAFEDAPRDTRADLFKEDVHRTLGTVADPLPGRRVPAPATLDGEHIGECPAVVPYGWRSFDRQYILADARLMGQTSASLWQAHSSRQVHFATLHADTLGEGVALTVTPDIPDFHFFCGRGGGVAPLWRDHECDEPNIAPGLVEYLQKIYGIEISASDVFAYAAALLGCPRYSERFAQELTDPGPRVPLTADARLFELGRHIGHEVVWLQTQGRSWIKDGPSPSGLICSVTCQVGAPRPLHRAK